MADPQLHVVFGAGQIGPPLARKLRDLGHQVRIVRRSSAAPIDGIEVASGDAMDAAFAKSATEGATAIYNCIGRPYFPATREFAGISVRPPIKPCMPISGTRLTSGLSHIDITRAPGI